MNEYLIDIAKDFSEVPGPRLKNQGDFSGEEFRNRILMPKFENALKNGKKLTINIDGAVGYAPSFLDEAFGGLVGKYDAKTILKTIDVKSDIFKSVTDDIKQFIQSKNNEK